MLLHTDNKILIAAETEVLRERREGSGRERGGGRSPFSQPDPARRPPTSSPLTESLEQTTLKYTAQMDFNMIE